MTKVKIKPPTRLLLEYETPSRVMTLTFEVEAWTDFNLVCPDGPWLDEVPPEARHLVISRVIDA